MKNGQNRMIIFLTSITLTILCAYGQSHVKQNSKIEESKLSIDTFSTFPPEIDGCSCYFSNDSTEFKKDIYIYINDFGQTSFLKINGDLIKFTQTDFKEIGETKTIAKAKSDDYEITVEINTGTESGYETSIHTGSIKLTDKKGRTITRAFYGLCGC